MTAKISAEVESRQRKSGYSLLDPYDIAPVGFMTLDERGGIRGVNMTMAENLGAPRDDICGQEFIGFLEEACRKRFLKWRADVSDEKTPLEVRLSSGRWLELREARLLPEERYGLSHIAALDVTARKAAEAALQESEHRYRSIIERTPSGVCITDENGRFEFANPSYCDFYGYRLEELVGKSFTLVVPEEARGFMADLHDRYIAGEEEVQGEWEVQTRDGERRTILADAARIVGPDGRQKKATFVTDISPRKRLESLHRDVERMTRHDLRTPLQGLINLPMLIHSAGETNAAQERLLKLVSLSAKSMLDTLNLSLAFIKMEGGTYEPPDTPVPVVALLRETLDLVAQVPACSQRGLEFRLEAADEDLCVRGDASLYRNMFMNLLRNACEASPQFAAVTIRVESFTRHMAVILSNEGEVPAEIRETFFEKDVTAGKKDGTGLGTYISRLIARTFGGDIRLADSSSGRITVVVTLPL